MFNYVKNILALRRILKRGMIASCMLKYCFIIILTVFSGLALPVSAGTFGAERFTLANGLEVVVIPNHRVPVVTHMVWYKVGAADETPGRSGLAHYLEHLLFKGTTTMAPGEYSKTIKKLGGNDNAFTGHDYTAFFESVSAEHLEQVMAMEADRMLNLSVPVEHFASEKSVVIEERRQRTDNDPKSVFGEQIQSTLFVNHPYGTPVIGWLDEMKTYEWKDVKKFYDTWYAPNNAILIISGDVTAAQVKPLAERIYGVLPRKDLPPRQRRSVPPANGQSVLTLRDKSVEQEAVDITFIAPAMHKDRAHALSLQVLENILDGGAATRLYRTLVSEQKKAVNVSFSYDSDALDYGTISLSGIPAPGVDVETLKDLLMAEIQKIVTGGVTENEVKEAIARLQDQSVFARDSIAGPAMIFGQALAGGSRVEDVENWPQDIQKITAADVKKAALAYLNPDKPYIRPPVVGYLLPEGKSP